MQLELPAFAVQAAGEIDVIRDAWTRRMVYEQRQTLLQRLVFPYSYDEDRD